MEESQIAAAFKALGDPTRLAIYKMIVLNDDICACKILETVDITQPTLSHHVKQLCSTGLIICTKRGKWMHYSADREVAKALAGFLA